MLLVDRIERRLVSAAWGVSMDVYDEVREAFDDALDAEPKSIPRERAELMEALGLL